MSYVVLAGVGAGVLWWMSSQEETATTGADTHPAAKNTDTQGDGDANKEPNSKNTASTTVTDSAGGYGDMAEISSLSGTPHMWIREERGVDSTGVPFRWIWHVGSTRKYKTFDLKYPIVERRLI